ncbi:MAG: nitronate monooxygenase [Aerococcus suis]|nr:nitronate monooxygenase [Aerococcus suis]
MGTKYPIICGAIARITTHEIAAAVSEAGSLGILGAGGWSADQLRDEIRQTKAMTHKPFGVNLMLQMDNISELVDVVIEEGV